MPVIRYVVTHLDKEGRRVLAHPRQGRHTYATPGEAQAWIDAALKNNSESTLRSVFGFPLEVRPVECFPGHFDPMTMYFDDEVSP
jgi:hypothetical protein